MEGQENLLADHISKHYEGCEALHDVSFSLQPGEILALSGENGAGKTTLIRILAGLLTPDQGQVLVCGRSMSKEPRAAKHLIGYAPEQFGVYDSMRGREYLEYYAAAYGMAGLLTRKRIAYLMELFSLNEAGGQYLDRMSAGMKQRFSIARCLLHNPALLLLDEPLNCLDPQGRSNFRSLMRALSKEGKSILISSHNLSQLEGICTSIGFMKRGRLQRKEMLDVLMAEAENDNPLLMKLADERQTERAVALFRPLPYVHSIAIQNQDLMVTFVAGQNREKELLELLLREKIATLFFGRERIRLEELFIRINQEELP